MTAPAPGAGATRLLGKIALETPLGVLLGDMRIRLLEAIETHGSISQAARAVPLSYKAAWDAVDAINNMADAPLVERSVGGRQGGGTRLTDYGRNMIALYRAMEKEYQEALDRVTQRLEQRGANDMAQFRSLMRRMAMKTSARNQFFGAIWALRASEVDYEVSLRLDDRNLLTAIITRASAENLGLAIGKQIYAFIKSSAVLLLTDPTTRISAANQLWGEISSIHSGPVNAEVTLQLPGGRTVTSVVTQASIDRLQLSIGSHACAMFKASDVILATFD
mgnify:FL=1|jgi:molybdate transport system regulatory protein